MTEWIPATGASVQLVHDRSRAVIARNVELALTRTARRKGLLGRASIASGAALVLAPCFAVHTAFMRFPIDVLFVDRSGRALRMIDGLQPWRAAASLRAYATIEMAAGTLEQYRVVAGDRLLLEHRC